ncbi:hypothetical protein L7F22_048540 [Adiantum nelumboides]|nr:hypothetical protein [Adiantum nelumboides]
MSLKGQDMEGLTEKMYEIAESQGEWLTKDELRQYASVSDEGRTAIINYLKSQGIQDSEYTFSDLGDEVEIRSSVSQASQMLSSNFEIFSVAGEKKREFYKTSKYVPSQGDPQNVDVAIVQYNNQSISQKDLTQFLKEFRPDAAGYSVPIFELEGAKNDPSKAGDEAMLDVEIVVGQTFPLQTTVYYFGDSDSVFSSTFQHFIKADSQPKIVTVSYAVQESELTRAQAFDNCWNAQKLAALGTTIFFGSGDWGVGTYNKSKTCPPFRPLFPSTCQFITSVGGTQKFSPEEVASRAFSAYYSVAEPQTSFQRLNSKSQLSLSI